MFYELLIETEYKLYKVTYTSFEGDGQDDDDDTCVMDTGSVEVKFKSESEVEENEIKVDDTLSYDVGDFVLVYFGGLN